MKHLALLSIIAVVVLAGCLDWQSPDPVDAMAESIRDLRSGQLPERKVWFTEGYSLETSTLEEEALMVPGSLVFCCPGTEEEKCVGREFPAELFDCIPTKITAKTDSHGKAWAYCHVEPNKPCLVGLKEVT